MFRSNRAASDGSGLALWSMIPSFPPLRPPSYSYAYNCVLSLVLSVVAAKRVIEKQGGKLSARPGVHGGGIAYVIELPLFTPTTLEYLSTQGVIRRDSIYFQRYEGLRLASRRITPQHSSPSHSRVSYYSEDKRVLVVDDSTPNRKMLGRLLLRNHMDRVEDVVEACDGEAAVREVEISMNEGRMFHAILMDFVMPNMDGPAAARRIRLLGYSGKIIGITGNTLPKDVEFFLSQGADRVLTKPVDINTLRKYLSGERDTTSCLCSVHM